MSEPITDFELNGLEMAARHTVGMNPSLVLRLVEEVKRLRAENEQLVSFRDRYIELIRHRAAGLDESVPVLKGDDLLASIHAALPSASAAEAIAQAPDGNEFLRYADTYRDFSREKLIEHLKKAGDTSGPGIPVVDWIRVQDLHAPDHTIEGQ